MMTFFLAAAFAATLTCDPSVFPTYVRPKGVPASGTLNPRGVPGAVSTREAFPRIETNAASAMIGLREGYMQRILWPKLVNAAGVAKFDGWGDGYENVVFATTNYTCNGDSWMSGSDSSSFSFDGDFENPTNRIFKTPRIVAGTKERADAIISRFLSKSHGFPYSGYWCVPGIDHMGQCSFGVPVDGENESLINFDNGAFLPLSRCIDDITNPTNTLASPRDDNYTQVGSDHRVIKDDGNRFYRCGIKDFSPQRLFAFPWYGVDANPNSLLGASCSSTNADGVAYDLRIGPKLSELLCAAAPGLPVAASNLHAIAADYKSPRIYWHRFALANALLGLTTDYVIPNAQAPDPNYETWDKVDMDFRGDNQYLRHVTKGIAMDVSSSSVATQVWSAVGKDAGESPVTITMVYDKETKSGGLQAVYDLDKFDSVAAGVTNTDFNVSCWTGLLENATFGWSDYDSQFIAYIVVTQELKIATFNDDESRDGYSSADVGNVPAGEYGPDCFRLDLYERASLVPGIDHEVSPAIFWSATSSNVPEELRGKLLQSLQHFTSDGAQATVFARQSRSSSGTFASGTWMRIISPYTDPKKLALTKEEYPYMNFMSSGMFPLSSGLEKYIDFNACSLLTSHVTTNGFGYIHDHADGNRTDIWRSTLVRHKTVPSAGNLTRAMTDDRGAAWRQMIGAHDEALGWDAGDDDEPEICTALNTNVMVQLKTDRLKDYTWKALTNETATVQFSTRLNLKLVVTEEDAGGDASDGTGSGTDVESAKVKLARWEKFTPDESEPISTLVFTRKDESNKKLRRSPYMSFSINNFIYMKFKFPMFDCSDAEWPAWTPAKEYEPQRPYHYDDSDDSSDSSESSSKDILE